MEAKRRRGRLIIPVALAVTALGAAGSVSACGGDSDSGKGVNDASVADSPSGDALQSCANVPSGVPCQPCLNSSGNIDCAGGIDPSSFCYYIDTEQRCEEAIA